jgi:hypothetical protein
MYEVGYPQINNETMGGISPTKQSIKNYLCMASNCMTAESVGEFDTLKARHICKGSNMIVLLDKAIIPVPTTRGMINAEVFYCLNCGKLIINDSSITVF